MEALKDAILRVMKQLADNKKLLSKDDPENIVKKILTKKELEHIRIQYFRKGVLGIAVDSSVWLYQLGMQKQQLLARMRNECDSIKDIRFRIGAVK